MAGVYIHIPFCKQACHYCDFHFSVNQNRIDDMVDALTLEIALQNNYLNTKELHTIYIGGGTPSLLKEQHFYKIFDALYKHFYVSPSCEITLEANPDDLSLEKLSVCKKIGFNRLSIGIQSLNDKILTQLNRSHNVHTALCCIEHARNVGFNNLSFDVMHSIPGQDDNVWIDTLETALQFNPEHLSAYALTLEQKTVFGRRIARQEMVPFDDDAGAVHMNRLTDIMAQRGYVHYEVSNFCRPGFQSLHNSSYWQHKPYLGIGPSAHSFNGTSRQYNIKKNIPYIQAIRANKIPCEIEMLSRENQINEYIFTTLRTLWGCDMKKLKDEYRYDLAKRHKSYVHTLKVEHLAFVENDHLFLTRKGKLLADTIAAELFADDNAS